MRWTTATVLVGLFAIPCGGCESCLDLDDYRLVDHYDVGTGGSSSTSSTSSGTGGGSSQLCPEGEPISGTLHVSLPVAPGGSGDPNDPCQATTSTDGGIDVYAFDPAEGSCVAHGRITRADGASLDSTVRIHHTEGTTAFVVGTFRDGSLELPNSCTDSSAVTLQEPDGATDTLFVAQLIHTGSTFCTSWTRTAHTQASVTLQVNTIEAAASDGVAIGGSLGGAMAQFDTGGALIDVTGGAFVAQYSADGSLVLEGIRSFEGSADDAVMGLERFASHWLVTGALRVETPSCHGCTGTTQVIDPVNGCVGAGGSGGSGGGSGGSGGSSGGAGGSAVGDALNALLWSKPSGDVSCADFATYGSDSSGSADAQVGYGVGVLSGGGQCTTYWTGLAGRAAWPFDSGDPNTALDDVGAASADGFVMRLDGLDGLTCGVGAQQAWSVRSTPSDGSAILWGNRVATNACSEGATATALFNGAADSTVELNRCVASGTCAPHELDLDLADVASQLLVTGFSPSGALDWYAAFGPVAAAAFDAGGAPVGVARDNLTLDNRGNAYLAFATTGPLATQNVSLSDLCLGFQLDALAGVYVTAFEQGGSTGTDNAACSWAHRIAP